MARPDDASSFPRAEDTADPSIRENALMGAIAKLTQATEHAQQIMSTLPDIERHDSDDLGRLLDAFLAIDDANADVLRILRIALRG